MPCVKDSPEFQEITKDIIIGTDADKTVQSPNSLNGSITMWITGNIRNKGNRTLSGLEVNAAVVDQFNGVLKEKTGSGDPDSARASWAGRIDPDHA